MRDDDLVRMINQIALYFDAYPTDEATAGVQEHLRKFWSPALRTQMLSSRQRLADALHPLARSALDALAAEPSA